MLLPTFQNSFNVFFNENVIYDSLKCSLGRLLTKFFSRALVSNHLNVTDSIACIYEKLSVYIDMYIKLCKLHEDTVLGAVHIERVFPLHYFSIVFLCERARRTCITVVLASCIFCSVSRMSCHSKIAALRLKSVQL